MRTVHICVNELGAVRSVEPLKPSSLPILNQQLAGVISLWRCRHSGQLERRSQTRHELRRERLPGTPGRLVLRELP
jgi:hypothetical protein